MFLDVSRVHSATVELLQATESKKNKKENVSGQKRAIVSEKRQLSTYYGSKFMLPS